MSDISLKQDIQDELDFEPSIDAADIGVAVEAGVVTLSGYVPNFAQKLTIERLVSRIRGVKGIAENIEVRYPGTSGTADDEITRRAIDTLRWNTVVPSDKVQVKVEDGWVTLTGTLEWNYQKIAAANAVRLLNGVTGISNRIELRPRVSPGNVKQRIQDSLKRNAELEAKSIRVNIAGSKVTLEGNVKAWHERRLAEQAAWSTPGVTAVDDRLTIE